MGGVTLILLSPDRVVINFQKMKDLPCRTLRLFADSQNNLKIYVNMGSNMYGLLYLDSSGLIWGGGA